MINPAITKLTASIKIEIEPDMVLALLGISDGVPDGCVLGLVLLPAVELPAVEAPLDTGVEDFALRSSFPGRVARIISRALKS